MRAAVLGLGRIGWCYHVKKIIENDKFELSGVVDPLEERRVEAEREFSTKAYATAEDLLEKDAPDLVVVASPTRFHVPQIIAAMDAGCDVFSDKPLAPDSAEAKKAVEAMRRTGRKLMVYQPHRATPVAAAVKDVLAMDLIGPVYMMKKAMSSYTRRNDWQAFRKNGGGMLNNYGAHGIDQLIYFTESKARKISCAAKTIASLGDAEDVVKAVLETENDIVLDIDINMATSVSFQPLVILGKRGSIFHNTTDNTLEISCFNAEDLESVEAHEELAAAGRKYGSGETIPWKSKTVNVKDYPPVEFYDKCYEYFAEDKAPFVPIEETMEVMRILDACRRDAGIE
jgi:scyllo-inositol 2-dehydrogenase (NADP+)